MDFGVFFANAGPFARPDPFSHLVTSAEAVGFESAWTIEHVAIPIGYTSKYPYDESGKIPMPDDTDMSDPLMPLAFAAAQTERIKLGTGILILPQQHPLYVAKKVATLDVLSKGRAILGVGIGWMRDEFNALGIPFEERAARTDESIRALRSLWKGEAEAFEGEFFSWNALHSKPSPVQEGGVPIVIGGHAPASARRAARFGDGFFPGVFGPEQLAGLLAVMRNECRNVGRDPAEIELTCLLAGTDLDIVHQFEDLGVSRLLVGYGFDAGTSNADITRYLESFSEAVIQKV